MWSLRAKIGVTDPRKIPSSAPLNESGFIFNIYFELEDIVEEGGPMEGGILVNYPSGPDSSHNAAEKRPREQNNSEEVGCSKSPKHANGAGKSDKGNTTVSSVDVIPSQYELDKNMVVENEVRQKLLDKKRDAEKGLSGVEQVNAEFANSAAMLEDFTEVPDSQKEEFDCTQDPDDFARRLGISTQKIKEINANVDGEMIAEENENLLLAQDKENRSPSLISSNQVASAPGRDVHQKRALFSDKVDISLQYPLQDLCGADAVKKQKMREAEARVQKAKDKAALDEAARRRSDRHKNKDEGQTVDKATEMAKKKNLEMAPGTNTPTILNTMPSFISHITRCIGVSLGKTPEEIDCSISIIKSLEKTRSDLFFANKRKEKAMTVDLESKLESFDPDDIRNLLSDSDSGAEEDEELRDELVLLSSLYKSRNRKTCTAGFSVKPKVRCDATNVTQN